MRIYYPAHHYNKNYRGLLFPLLKPFIKDEHFSDAQRIQLYGVFEKDFIDLQLANQTLERTVNVGKFFKTMDKWKLKK